MWRAFVTFFTGAENGADNHDVETVEFCDLMVVESGGMNEMTLGVRVTVIDIIINYR